MNRELDAAGEDMTRLLQVTSSMIESTRRVRWIDATNDHATGAKRTKEFLGGPPAAHDARGSILFHQPLCDPSNLDVSSTILV